MYRNNRIEIAVVIQFRAPELAHRDDEETRPGSRFQRLRFAELGDERFVGCVVDVFDHRFGDVRERGVDLLDRFFVEDITHTDPQLLGIEKAVPDRQRFGCFASQFAQVRLQLRECRQLVYEQTIQ